MITIYPYELNSVSYELFPPELSKNAFVVFHGTSSVYSNLIERDGLIPGHTPFNLLATQELLSILELDSVKAYDKKEFVMNVAEGLKMYISNIENGNAKLSFSCLSYNCVLFASGRLKGGQILDTLRKAKAIVYQAVSDSAISESLITPALVELFDSLDNHSTMPGVIYAVQLDESLKGISIRDFVIYSVNPIPVRNIIGKVLMPIAFDISTFDRMLIGNKNKAKLNQGGGLGAILNRREFPEIDPSTQEI